jgi:hypothetical protein
VTAPRTLAVEFVRFVPEQLEAMTLYISMEFATTSHLCFCGCGNKVVLPLSPTDWQLYYDGRTVWLTPSVGSWDLPCRSHYWIRGSTIITAPPWTDDQVEAAAAADDETKAQYVGRLEAVKLVGDEKAAGLRRRRRSWRPRWLRRRS